MRRPTTNLSLTVVFLVVGVPGGVVASGQDLSAFEDDWKDDWEEGWEKRAAAVNEGALRLLESRTDLREHHHYNQLTITQAGLETGWVDLYQCHTNLGVTPALQIVFVEGRTRELRIVSQAQIGRAWIEKNTVQLKDISPGSSICISLKSRALSIEDKVVLLRNGPFMRRFLDGYYPMRVSMRIEYPTQMIRYTGMKPVELARRIDHHSGLLEFDARFEGRLNTEVSFEQIKLEDQ